MNSKPGRGGEGGGWNNERDRPAKFDSIVAVPVGIARPCIMRLATCNDLCCCIYLFVFGLACELRVRVMWLQWLPLPLLNIYRRSCCGLVQAILTRNGVSYRGCVERSDLVDKVCSIGDRRAHGGRAAVGMGLLLLTADLLFRDAVNRSSITVWSRRLPTSPSSTAMYAPCATGWLV